MSIYLIYKHTSPSGKAYIGQTNNYNRRSNIHKNTLGKCTYFYNAIRKYGWENFKHEILIANLTLEEANYWENYYIIEHNTLSPNGYNLKTGGDECVVSTETKIKMSISAMGKIVPIRSRSSLEGYVLRYGEEEGPKLYNEHKLKKDSASLQHYISKHGEDQGKQLYEERSKRKSQQRSKLNIGFKHSEESKRKISESKIGRKVYRSKEHNMKIGLANKGKVMPTATCPHCGKVGATSNMIRWHFSNCKYQSID